MKKENIIYLSAFLCGVVGTNILESKGWIDSVYLYRYHLLQLSFDKIDYEAYLLQILFLRFETVGVLWILGKVIPLKWLRHIFGAIICTMMGMIFTLSILANGVWGVVLMVGIVFPQWFFYVGAYMVWGTFQVNYTGVNQYKSDIGRGIVLILFVILGCICEAYVNPSIVKLIIKY